MKIAKRFDALTTLRTITDVLNSTIGIVRDEVYAGFGERQSRRCHDILLARALENVFL